MVLLRDFTRKSGLDRKEDSQRWFSAGQLVRNDQSQLRYMYPMLSLFYKQADTSHRVSTRNDDHTFVYTKIAINDQDGISLSQRSIQTSRPRKMYCTERDQGTVTTI